MSDRTDRLCPAVFLDRDGTSIDDRGHSHCPSHVVFYNDTAPSLLRMQEHFDNAKRRHN